MSAMRKIGEYLGLLEDTGVYDDEYDEQGYSEPSPSRRSSAPSKAPAPVADISQRRRAHAPDGAPAFNPAFDVTPADLVTAIVTQDRVWRP